MNLSIRQIEGDVSNLLVNARLVSKITFGENNITTYWSKTNRVIACNNGIYFCIDNKNNINTSDVIYAIGYGLNGIDIKIVVINQWYNNNSCNPDQCIIIMGIDKTPESRMIIQPIEDYIYL
jgi:hypothetical protein